MPFVLSVAGSLFFSSLSASAAIVDLPRHPALSPNGQEITFTWRGDVWKVPFGGGQATRLTTHPAADLRTAWNGDGSLIAFESERDGFRNLFVMRPDGTGIEQVTQLDTPQSLVAFGAGPNGTPVLTFDAAIENDLYRSARPYAVALSGGTPFRVHDAFGTNAQYSRDGSKVLFERGGSAWSRRHYRGPDARDVWLFDVKSGAFTRLTDWAGNDGLARWAGDDAFVFLSDREDNCVNLYLQKLAPGSQPVRLTNFKDTDVQAVSVSADGKRAVVSNWDALYSVDLTSGKPNATKLSITANDDGLDDMTRKAIGREISEAALSPDGATLAVVAYGDVWVKGTADKSVPRRVTDGVGRERDIAWSADGLTLYFVSDRDDNESIYAAKVDKTRDEIRKRTEERLSPPKPAPEPKPEPKPESKPDPAPADPAATPSAKPAEPAADKPAEPPAEKADGEKKAATEKDKAKEKKKDPALDPARWADAITFTIEPFLHEATLDTRPTPSPDGKSMAFRRGNGDIMVLDLATRSARPLVKGFDADVEFRWSPDSKLIAYAMDDRNFNSDIWLIPADGSEPARNITRHPDSDRSPRFSADGKILAFISERTNEEFDVWCVFLEKDLESLQGKDLEQYYKDAAEAAKKRKPVEPVAAAKPDEKPAEKPEEKPAEKKEGDAVAAADTATEKPKEDAKPASPFGDLDLDDAYLRVRRVTALPGNETNIEILPSGEKIVFVGADGKESGLFAIKNDGTGQQRLAAGGSVQGLNFAGDRVVLVQGGSASSVGASGGDAKAYDVSDTIDVDLAVLNEQKFREAMRVLGSQFYHPTMKGLDWEGMTERYLELAKRARTSDEFDWIANRQLGELNASHLGIRSPDATSPLRRPQGRLGTRTKPVDGGFEVTEIIDFSPAALAKQPILVGDVITAIDFEPFGAGDVLETRLAGKIGKEVVVSVRRARPDGDPLLLDILIVPVSSMELGRLAYAHTTLRNRKLVDEWSNGQLGYIHIRGMDQSSLDDFERDLFASAEGKKGLLIDVRNNGGGSTADLLLSSIMVRPHAYTVPRGGDESWKDGYPQDRLYIQRYTLPINMLCNEKSFSNAEIISHAFKTLGRGTLVGQQTYGGVISTGGTSLLDGTTVRLPFRGWYLPDGRDMENNGAMPDLVVPQTPEDESRNSDAQLKAAVDDLLKRLP
ncbi:MAG: PD40 domain-containing protein [Phycisphaerae bacterium]|nr:PD40 domain-containing protein [Phycisphaerae bacterium]